MCLFAFNGKFWSVTEDKEKLKEKLKEKQEKFLRRSQC